MSTIDDPLGRFRSEGSDRLNYRLGIALDADDFEQEQLYHRGRLALALKYTFGVGTVAGLGVSFEDDELRVAPGLALDALGRMIELPRPACIRLSRWYAAAEAASLRDALRGPTTATEGEVIADVFIRFVTCPRGKTPAVAAGPFDATNAVADARLRDGYELTLVARTDADETGTEPRPDSLEALRAILAAEPAPSEPDTPETRLNARLGALHDLILGGWRDDTDDWSTVDDEPRRLREVPDGFGVDATAVLLARVRIPAERALPGERPRYLDRTPEIDNRLRRFVYAPGVLTRLPAL